MTAPSTGDRQPSTVHSPLSFCQAVGIRYPVICGAMYPCSNPELVAAVSDAGGIGIVQPVTLTYVHRLDLRDGLRRIRALTAKPIGFNALIEQSSRAYHERMVRYVNVALEEGVRFFVTSLGKPRWVVDAVHAVGGLVYHDVTDARWAAKAKDGGVDGLIAVNNRAGGHAGGIDAAALLESLRPVGLPVIGAGGVGSADDFVRLLSLGYVGAQLGTRFIATTECDASAAYKQAIVDAEESDIVLTERLTGVPVAVLNTEYVRRTGTRAGWLARWMLRGRKTKHWMRTIYAVRAGIKLRQELRRDDAADYWQAGKSVRGITGVVPAREVVEGMGAAWERQRRVDG